MIGWVTAVASSRLHDFSKQVTASVVLVAGLGVADDAHSGAKVQHRSRVAVDPTQPNLRQVHLIQSELFDELRVKGFSIKAADLGENITTEGLDLLALPQDTLLRIGTSAVLRVTGLRNPCVQIERFRSGLLAAVLEHGPNNELIRKAGIMTVVKIGGTVSSGDRIEVALPPLPHQPLKRV